MNALYFWAQALDNESEDFISKVDGVLTDLGGPAASSCVSEMSLITQTVNEDKISDRLSVFCGSEKSLLKIIPVDKDVAGRLAPILCMVSLSNHDPDSILQGLDRFLLHIDRKVDDALRSDILLLPKHNKPTGAVKFYRSNAGAIEKNGWTIIIIAIALGYVSYQFYLKFFN